MIIKRDTRNRITLPRSLTERMGSPRLFDVSAENGRIVLRAVDSQKADAIRAKLADIPIEPVDVGRAARWARRRGR